MLNTFDIDNEIEQLEAIIDKSKRRLKYLKEKKSFFEKKNANDKPEMYQIRERSTLHQRQEKGCCILLPS
jgi:hypothetical protein